jgi:hypothetical protein
MSPGLQQKIVYVGANSSSFDKARQEVAKLMDLEVKTKQIERLTERIGHERQTERDEEVEHYSSLPLTERKDQPKDVVAPSVAVVGVDGGRLQILERSTAKVTKKVVKRAIPMPAEEKAEALPAKVMEPAVPVLAEEKAEALPADEQHRGTHWREDKIAKYMTMDSEVQAEDPCPEVLKVFVNPARILKLTRELKTKKAAVGDSKQNWLPRRRWSKNRIKSFEKKPRRSSGKRPRWSRALRRRPSNPGRSLARW